MSASAEVMKDVVRRLEAGDWVVTTAQVQSLPGLGKLIEGDYDTRDATLLRAQVEWTHGVHWVSASNLVRIEPAHEAELVRQAIANRVTSASRIEQLRGQINAFDRGDLKFVRSPGLLDLLWSSIMDDDRPSGLVKFFEESALPVFASSVVAPEPAAMVEPESVVVPESHAAVEPAESSFVESPVAKPVVARSALEKLRKKRSIDPETSALMISLGWRQGSVLEGLMWCVNCSQPTVWKDQAGSPSHLWCSDVAAQEIAC